MERYPTDTEIGIDDFKSSDWADALDAAQREDYSSMWRQLSSKAGKAIEDGELAKGKALWLLADACSLMLKPESLNEPFGPLMVMEGRRSALTEDFNEADIAFFSIIVPHIKNPRLCSRLADIVWLMLNPKDPNYARIAIDNYRKLEISTENWNHDARECWDRAIQLCLMLRDGAGERLWEIESELIAALKAAVLEDGYLASWLAELLSKHKLGRNEQLSIATKLEELAIQFDDTGQLQTARDYFDLASEYYQNTESPKKSVEMISKCAEGWAKEAEVRQGSESPSAMVAASFYENAIQKYRAIPKALREEHNVDSRIKDLRALMNAAGENTIDEMGKISSEPIDISKLIESSIRAVKGKDLNEALLSFSNIYSGASVESIRKLSEELIATHPIQSLFGATHYSLDGRVVAKRPAAGLGEIDQIKVVWPEMIKHYSMELGLVVQGDIWPALEILRLEHRIRESDINSIVSRSPLIPPDRTRLVAKAIFHGFDGDFVNALHLLIPQMENLVRYHLKRHGESTTNIDKNGIENENGLSTLAENPKFEIIFGKDIAFEIKALFCDSFGPNLRNELAHGLLGFDDSQNTYSIYAWWLTFRLAFKTYWNSTHVRESEKEGTSSKDV